MPDNMGSLLRGLRIGQGIGGTIVDRRNERQDRQRRRELEDELRGYTREDREISAEERARRKESEEELRGYRREDRGWRLEDRGTAAEDRRTAAADRTRRMEMEDELRGFTREDRGQRSAERSTAAAAAGAQEYGEPSQLEEELKRMSGIADADMTPELGDREGALRRQLAALLEQRRQEQLQSDRLQRGARSPRETLEMDPLTGDVISQRVTRPYTPGTQEGEGTLRAPGSTGGATITGPVQIRNAQDYAALPSGTDYIDPDGVKRRKP